MLDSDWSSQIQFKMAGPEKSQNKSGTKAAFAVLGSFNEGLLGLFRTNML